MSLPLFKHLTKQNWVLFTIFAGLMMFYLLVLILIYPTMTSMVDMFDQFPELFDGVYGMEGWETAMTYTASFYSKSLVFAFSMIFYIMLSNKLVNKTVSNTSLSSYLSTSLSRTKYIVTCGIFFAVSIITIFVLMWLIGGAVLLAFGTYNFALWTNVIVSTLLCSLAVAFISFFFSCIFAGNGIGQALLIGVPILFLVFTMLYDMSSALNFMKYMTPFGWIDALEIAQGTSGLWWLWDIIYAAIIGTMFTLSVIIFKRKQLSI